MWALEELRVNSSGISSIDVSNNTKLIKLWAGALRNLDVRNNTELETLIVYGPIDKLDLTNNPLLKDNVTFGGTIIKNSVKSISISQTSATITALAEDRSGVKATCNVVIPPSINVSYRTHI